MSYSLSAMTIVARTIVDVNVQDIVFSNLDSNRDRFYKIFYAIKNNVTGLTIRVNILINGLPVGNTIFSQVGPTGLITGGVATVPFEIATLEPAESACGEFTMHVATFGATPRTGVSHNSSGEVSQTGRNYFHTWNDSFTNISSLTIHTDTVTGGLGQGTDILLCRS